MTRRLLLGPAAILVLGACGIGAAVDPPEDRPIDLSPMDLAGTWTNPRKGNVLVFREDGTFTAHNLPHQMLPDFPGILPSTFDKEHDTIDATGTWRLVGNPTNPNTRRAQVDLSFDAGPVILRKGGSSLYAD
jgi:hypothetical protein